MQQYIMIMFFFNDTATTEIYTLSLHDALPIYFYGAFDGGGRVAFNALSELQLANAPENLRRQVLAVVPLAVRVEDHPLVREKTDRKSTRLNSSHANISYAVFCLKKKNTSALYF